MCFQQVTQHSCGVATVRANRFLNEVTNEWNLRVWDWQNVEAIQNNTGNTYFKLFLLILTLTIHKLSQLLNLYKVPEILHFTVK